MHACKGGASWSRRGLFERIVAEVPGGVTSSSPMNGMPTIIILCEPHLSQVELVPRWLSAVELRVSGQLRALAFRWRRMSLGARLSGLG
jgi:hypothetical protein